MNLKSIHFYILIGTLIIISFLIGIPQTINSLLHNEIFYKYFNKGETQWYYDLILIVFLLSVYIYGNKLYKIIKYPSSLTLVALLLYVLIVNYRYSYSNYLTNIYFNPCYNWFKYFDVLFLIPIIILISYYINTKNDKSHNNIEDDTIDVLNTKEKVEYFWSTIKPNFNFYGIVGKWGVGKTHFLDLLKIKINDDDNTNNIVVEFTPWKFNSIDLMIRDFSNKIENELVSKGLIKKSEYKKFSKDFIGSINTIKLPFIEFSTSLQSEYNSDEQFEKINKAISNSKFQFYIIIDDLDRLQNEEVYKVLMFLRNVFNFNKLFFIAAYDKDYLVRSLESLNIPNSINYLEKIFQSEFILHSLTLNERIFHLKEKLLEKFSKKEDEINKILSSEFMGVNYNAGLFIPFKVYRNILHFINDFENSNKKISREVDFESLFYINILKYFYNDVYEEIYENSNFYFQLDSYEVLKSKRNSNFTNLNEKDNIPYIDKYIEALLISQQDKECISFIINKLFTNVHHKGHLSISLSNNFNKYFTGIIPNTVISNNDFEKYINKVSDINLLDKVLYPSFINILKKYTLNEIQKSNTITILFFLIKKYPEYTNYESLFEIIINKNKECEEEFINKFFTEVKDTNIEYKIKLLYVFAEISLDDKDKYLDQTKSTLNLLLAENIKSIDDILKIIYLYQVFKLKLSETNKIALKNKLKQIIIIKEDDFIKRMVNPVKQNGKIYYNIYDGMVSIFANVFDSDLKELKEFLFTLNTNENIQEFLRFVNLLNNNKPIVEPQFSEIFIEKFKFESF